MTTDFRALCAELTATLAERIDDKGDAGSYYIHAAHLLARARAALADEPPEPAPPADGEVAELVEWLQEEADDYECIGCEDSAAKCNRAAELLQRPMADLSPTAYELLTLAAELES